MLEHSFLEHFCLDQFSVIQGKFYMQDSRTPRLGEHFWVPILVRETKDAVRVSLQEYLFTGSSKGASCGFWQKRVRLSQKNPRAHKNRIGTIPPPPLKRGIFMDMEVFLEHLVWSNTAGLQFLGPLARTDFLSALCGLPKGARRTKNATGYLRSGQDLYS